MPISFPTNPSTGQSHSHNNKTYKFNGKRWYSESPGLDLTPYATTADVAAAIASNSGGLIEPNGSVNNINLNNFNRNAVGYIDNASTIANYPQSTARNGMLIDFSSYGLGGTHNDEANERALQMFAADTSEDSIWWRVKQGTSGWHSWKKLGHDYAIKEGPSSYNSPYKSNWSYGYDNGTSMDATSNGTGIVINESGYYHVTTYQRSGGADMYVGLGLNGDRTTLENRAGGLWGHDHAGYGGGWSHSIYIGPLSAGEIITAGTPTTQTAQYSTTGYSGGIYIVRIV